MINDKQDRRAATRVVYPGVTGEYSRKRNFLHNLVCGAEEFCDPLPVMDISEKGLQIETNECLDQKHSFLFRIIMDNDSPVLELEGRVVWQAESTGGYKFKTGIEFVNLDEDTRSQLKGAIKQLMRSVL